jgi:hypothetical protein
MNKYLYYWTWNLVIILLLYVWFEHSRHTYEGFVPSFSERGMTSTPAPIKSPTEDPRSIPPLTKLSSPPLPCRSTPPLSPSWPPSRRLDAWSPRRRLPSGEAQNEFPASHSSSSTHWPAPLDTGAAGGRAPTSSVPPSMACPPWTEAGRGQRLMDRVHGFFFSKIIPWKSYFLHFALRPLSFSNSNPQSIIL